MTCKEFGRRLTDYLDDGGDVDQQRRMDRHAVSCPECAEQINEARFALKVLRQAPKVEPPAELVAEILHETIGVNVSGPVPAGAGRGAHGGLWGFFEPLLQPMLQPRLVMGMAMTMVSFSMLGLHGKSLIEIWNAGRVEAQAAVEEVGEGWAALREQAERFVGTLQMLYQLHQDFEAFEAAADEPAAPDAVGPSDPRAQPPAEQPQGERPTGGRQ